MKTYRSLEIEADAGQDVLVYRDQGDENITIEIHPRSIARFTSLELTIEEAELMIDALLALKGENYER